MESLEDYRIIGKRRQLVELLRSKGIGDEAVLEAIGRIPRHAFLDDSALHIHAYEDVPFPIGCGQTISQPYTVAFQTQLLGVSKGQKVLEIGTGSGYQTAVLHALGAKIYSIERHRPLFLKTKERLSGLGVKAQLYYGDGYKGLPAHAPFDRILVTCGAPFIPDALVEQLAPGGRMVVPVGESEFQRMLRVSVVKEGGTEIEDHGKFRFVPMLTDKAR
ncbi:MAG: protein-L-isoaspartate(D-aspartate) O-methyltransferase [Flavobacteriales bacterium]|nr:protein-L-isoaspartate(D-aspartate) O-methyltransferase [Flavobacteriales bacterium]